MKRRAITQPQRPPSVPVPQLPHERDESVDPPRSGAVRGEIRQAQRDLDAGRVDTDNYTRTAENAEPVLDAPVARGPGRVRRRA